MSDIEMVVDAVVLRGGTAQVVAQRRPTDVDGEVVDHWCINLNQLGWGNIDSTEAEIIATSEEERDGRAAQVLDLIEQHQAAQVALTQEFRDRAVGLRD